MQCYYLFNFKLSDSLLNLDLKPDILDFKTIIFDSELGLSQIFI
jgi:hypothetical protein